MLHSELGRWTGRDPAHFIDGLSLYQYAISASIRHRDPTGLATRPFLKIKDIWVSGPPGKGSGFANVEVQFNNIPCSPAWLVQHVVANGPAVQEDFWEAKQLSNADLYAIPDINSALLMGPPGEPKYQYSDVDPYATFVDGSWHGPETVYARAAVFCASDFGPDGPPDEDPKWGPPPADSPAHSDNPLLELYYTETQPRWWPAAWEPMQLKCPSKGCVYRIFDWWDPDGYPDAYRFTGISVRVANSNVGNHWTDACGTGINSQDGRTFTKWPSSTCKTAFPIQP